MDKIKDQIITTLTMQGIDLDSAIEYEVNKKPYTLTFRFIIDSYLKGSEESRLVFLTALKKAQKAGNMGIEKFFEGMGQLLLMSSLSKKL
jgi:hypothetical protein